MSSVKVTIKYGKGYEESWAVFEGSIDQLRLDIAGYFGMDENYVGALTLHEVVSQATAVAHGTSNVMTTLGGTVVNQEKPQAGPTGASAWDRVDGEAGGEQHVESSHAWLVDALGKAESLDALKKLWAENQSAFSDATVTDAYKARGKELKAAA